MEILTSINAVLEAITRVMNLATSVVKKNNGAPVEITEKKTPDAPGQTMEGPATVAGFRVIGTVNGKSVRFVRWVTCNTCGHRFGMDLSDHRAHMLMDADLFSPGIACVECNSPDVFDG